MLKELLSPPQFVTPKKSREEWGEFFVQTAAAILANSGSASFNTAIDNAIRLSATLTESLIEISHQK